MIYSRTDVDFIDHPRAMDAGPLGRDLWQWGNLYSRKHELDGMLPESAVLRSQWGACGKANAKVAATLVKVGLWLKVEGGWKIFNYAAKNETKEDIVRRRAKERDKKARQRGGHRSMSPGDTPRDATGDKQGDSPNQSQIQNQIPPKPPEGGGCDPKPEPVKPEPQSADVARLASLPDPAIDGILQSALNAAGYRQRVEAGSWRAISAAFKGWLPGQSAQEHWDSVALWAKRWASDPDTKLEGVRMPAKIFLFWCNTQEGLGVEKPFVPYHQPAELPPLPTDAENAHFAAAVEAWDLSQLGVAS